MKLTILTPTYNRGGGTAETLQVTKRTVLQELRVAYRR